MAMDEAVRLKYRELTKSGFTYVGKIENPSITLDTMEEGVRLCSAPNQGYINIYISIENNRLAEVKYMCACDPTANVVIETMCEIMTGKTLDEARATTPEAYFSAIGSRGEMLTERIEGMIELVNRGIEKYRFETAQL